MTQKKLLGETKLNPKTPLKLTNYHVYQQDNSSITKKPASEDTATLVHKIITHYQANIPTSMDSTTITIKLGSNQLRVSSVHKSPNFTLMRSDLDALTKYNGPFLISGDLNAKHMFWHSRSTNRAGRILYHHMEKTNLYSVCPSLSNILSIKHGHKLKCTQHCEDKSTPPRI